MSTDRSKKDTVPAQAYETDYYESACDGFKEFSTSHGRSIPLRLKLPLVLAKLEPGMHIIDIGCGRGEVIYHAVQLGTLAWGVDYSKAAVGIASTNLKENLASDQAQHYAIQRGEATHLPFKDGSFDRIFMLDIVEHLTPNELEVALFEVHRILNPTGYLIIHTMPSLWYYRYGYPIFRFMENLRGKKLPVNPRDRCDYSHLHVNEQSLSSLGKTLKNSDFKARVWLQSTQEYAYERNLFIRGVMKFLVSVYPFRWIFCDDIFALGQKKA